MPKTFKAAAVVLSLAFVLAAVPTLNSAPIKPVKLSLALFLNQPIQTLSAAFPFLSVFFARDGRLAPVSAGKSIVKPTDSVSIGKPGSGD